MRRTITTLLLLIASITANADGDAPSIREFDVKTIESLGKVMHQYDLAAAHATDILFQQGLDLRSYPVAGWVVTQDKDGVLVTFVGKTDKGERGLFDIRPNASAEHQFRLSQKRELTPQEAAQFRAREVARQQLDRPCSDNYNSIVIKEPGSDNWLVYWIAATQKAGVVVVGGHYRFTVSADGRVILNRDRLSNSCLAIDQNEIPEGASATALLVTHIVSPTPVETHLFLGLLHKVDLVVSTGRDVAWSVSGGKINRITLQ